MIAKHIDEYEDRILKAGNLEALDDMLNDLQRRVDQGVDMKWAPIVIGMIRMERRIRFGVPL